MPQPYCFFKTCQPFRRKSPESPGLHQLFLLPPALQFVCRNDKCIPFWWKCDTEDDCGDHSDEPPDCRECQVRGGRRVVSWALHCQGYEWPCPPPALVTLSLLPSRQLSSSAAQDSSSAQQASARTLPSSVMGTMTARTTVTRPTAVKGCLPLPHPPGSLPGA